MRKLDGNTGNVSPIHQDVKTLTKLIIKGEIPSIEQITYNGSPTNKVKIGGEIFYLDAEECSMLVDEMVAHCLIEDKIPENSKTLLISEETSRFSSAIWFDKIRQQSVTLAGLGGIGSYVAFLLSRLGINTMTLYDPDTVERVNLSGQLYSENQIGDYKVNAISDMMVKYSDYYGVIAKNEKLDKSSAVDKITICGFDNMKARKEAFENWANLVDGLIDKEREKCLFIDGRLAAEEFQVFCIKGSDIESMLNYRSYFLFSDYQADATVCSYKQTTFMANMIGSIIVNLFVNFIANQCDPLIDRDLPFYTEYNAETMYFKTVA